MKKNIIYSLIIAFAAIAFLTLMYLAAVKNDAELTNRQYQIEHVADVTEETVFKTSEPDEVDQLINEINNSGKQIVKLKVIKENNSKNAALIYTITYK